MAVEGQQIKLPEKGSLIEFDRYNTKLECPFVIYGDFECLTIKSEDGIRGIYGTKQCPRRTEGSIPTS